MKTPFGRAHDNDDDDKMIRLTVRANECHHGMNFLETSYVLRD